MSAVIKTSNANLLDKAAIGISAACLVQCLMLPVSFLLLPVLSMSPAVHTLFHLALLVVVLPLSLLAFAQGWRRHGSRRVLGLGGAGLILLIITAALGHSMLSTGGEALLTSTGGVFLIIAHFLNIRLARDAAAVA